MRSKKALKNIVVSLVQQIVTIICGLILPRMIIGTYGSNVNGLISSITQFLSYITLLESGVGPVIKSVLYTPIAKKDKKQIERILKSGQRFFNVIAYIFIAYLVILSFIYPQIVSSEFETGYTISLLLIISISTFAQYFFGMTYQLYLQAEQKTYITSGIQAITTILNTVISIILIKLGMNIHIVKLFSAAIFVLRPLVQNIYVKKKYNINLKEVDNSFKLKQKWDGLAQHIAAVIHGNTDVTILTIFTNTAEVSVYTVYLFVVNGIKNLVQALTGGMDASFGDMYARNEKEHLNKSFKNYEFFYYTIVTIIFTCTLCLIIPFITVYTKGIEDINYIRPLFGALIVIAEYIWAIRLPYNSLILATGHFKQTQTGAWIEAISNILISIILVNKLGIIGVTIGTLIAMLIRTIEFMFYTAKNILERNWKYAFRHFLITIIETIIIYICSYYIMRNVKFINYAGLIEYGIIILAISCIIVVITNSIIYREQAKETVNMLKNNLIKRK